MGASAFLALLVCVHVVAGSGKCPDADKPVEVIAREIGSDEEAVTIMACESVSVDKGNEIKNLRQVSGSHSRSLLLPFKRKLPDEGGISFQQPREAF